MNDEKLLHLLSDREAADRTNQPELSKRIDAAQAKSAAAQATFERELAHASPPKIPPKALLSFEWQPRETYKFV